MATIGRPARDLARTAALAAVRGSAQEDRLRELRWALRPDGARRNRRDDAALVVALASVLRRDSDCIDVGANRGSVLAHMVRLAPAGRHTAFEPLPDLGAALAQRFPQVDVRTTALSNGTGRATFVRRPDPALSSLESAPADWRRRDAGLEGAQRIEVEVARLDDVLPEGLRPAFIKIDVEDHEYQVLEGALETLREHRPVVAFEHSLGARAHGHEPGDVHHLLTEQAGLRIFDADGGGPYDRAALRAEVLTGRRWFFFARPWD
jgi:FkbM family methyltransferase